MSSTAARIGLDAIAKNPNALARGFVGMGSVLANLPRLAWVGYNSALGFNPLMVDAITTMFLYLLGQLTLSLFTGKMSSRSVLTRWAFFGVLDGVFTHGWYHIVEWISSTLAPGSSQGVNVGVKLLFTGGFYTPGYCLLFILVGALWERKSVPEIRAKFRQEAWPLLKGTVPLWTGLNVILFWHVPIKYRVLICEIFHYIYLIGLAIWESGNRAKQQAIRAAEAKAAQSEEGGGGGEDKGSNDGVAHSQAVA